MLRLTYLVLTAVVLVSATAAASPTIDNPAAAPRQIAVTLDELWRAGGDDESEVLLGQVANAAVATDGTVYVLDTQLSHVLAFAKDGTLMATLGREGDGPGEMRRPIGLDVRPDGVVGIVQAFPGKIIYLNPDGMPSGSFTLGSDDPARGGFAILQEAHQRDDVLVVSAVRSVFRPDDGTMLDEHTLAAVTADGEERHCYARLARTRNLQKMTFDELADWFPGERGRWTLGPDGRLSCATAYGRYEITQYAPDGSLLRVITRPHDARMRTDAEKDALRGGMQIDINGQKPEIEEVLQDRDPCIRSMVARDDGTLWVENSHGRDRWDRQGIVIYDVYDGDGRLVADVTLTVPQGGEGNRLIPLRDGRFMLVRGQDRLTLTVSTGDNAEGTDTSAAAGSDVPLELVCFAAPRL